MHGVTRITFPSFHHHPPFAAPPPPRPLALIGAQGSFYTPLPSSWHSSIGAARPARPAIHKYRPPPALGTPPLPRPIALIGARALKLPLRALLVPPFTKYRPPPALGALQLALRALLVPPFTKYRPPPALGALELALRALLVPPFTKYRPPPALGTPGPSAPFRAYWGTRITNRFSTLIQVPSNWPCAPCSSRRLRNIPPPPALGLKTSLQSSHRLPICPARLLIASLPKYPPQSFPPSAATFYAL
ncbi:hypothetical protein C8R46DRAFT_1232096 [Mycena filopes]|nr:hypothetical protein C8R46DRAFT_1232096 [Mycena filopes]